MRRQAAHGSHVRISVSISDEKPLHMRRFREEYHEGTHDEFQSQTRSRSTCDTQASGNTPTMKGFQSQTRSRSTCDPSLIAFGLLYPEFQSQTRSRSTCDFAGSSRPCAAWYCFNLRREAAPHATSTGVLCSVLLSLGFNLRR